MFYEVYVNYRNLLAEKESRIRRPFVKGWELEQQYEYERAVEQYKICLERAADDDQTAMLQLIISFCYLRLNQFEEALLHCNEAEKAAQKIRDRDLLATVLQAKGVIYRNYWEFNKAKEDEFYWALNAALDCHQKSLEIFREIGSLTGEFTQLGNIGVIYKEKGNWDEALDYFFQSLDWAKESGHLLDLAVGQNNIGSVYGLKGENNKALEYFEDAIRNYRAAGDKRGEARSLCSVAKIHQRNSNWNMAIEFYQVALTIYEQLHFQREVEEIKSYLEKFVMMPDVM